MLGKIGIPLLSLLLLSDLLFGQGEWKKVHYTQWSINQVDAILNGSPWTALIFAGHQPTQNLGTDRVFFRIRLLTARPVREALLRKMSLHVPIVELEDLRRGAAEEKTVREFVRSRPNDIRVTGDDRSIVFGITLRIITGQGWEELDDEETLSSSNISDLIGGASLATNDGKRVRPSRYEAPNPDRLGAKLYFPRNLADGRPFIASDDKELYFETQLNDRQIRVRFDLGRMKYQGELEF